MIIEYNTIIYPVCMKQLNNIHRGTDILLLTINNDIEEITELLNSLGYTITMIFRQGLERPDPRTYMGKGKVQQIYEYIKNSDKQIDLVVVNGVLEPSQHYNLEKAIERPVFDRLRIILEIFMKRARSTEAILQVELAKYQYELPFVREWVHKMKKGEHPGFMAGGAYQTDQYLEYIRKRIKRIGIELEHIKIQNSIRRKRRIKSGVFTVSVAGYTNAGKSCLMNALSGVDVVVSNQLFTTLDTLTRRISTGLEPDKEKSNIVITDTIGFIKDIPPWMIMSFQSTLEEIRRSNIILLVSDVSDPIEALIEKIHISEKNLTEIETEKIKPNILLILNKIDKIDAEDLNKKLNVLRSTVIYEIFPISALTGNGISSLLNYIINKSKSITKL